MATEIAVQLFEGVTNFQPLFTEVQLALHHPQLLHNLHHPSLSIPHQLLQRVLEIAQTPIMINFPMELGVIHLGKCHVDAELPFIPTPQVFPLKQGHGVMSRDPPIYLDWA